VLISAHAGYPRWLRSGADFIEVDVRRDHRGVIVDSHDEPKAGERHATLDEILAAAAGRIGLHLDLKEQGFEVELVRMTLERFAADTVVVTPDFESSSRIIKQHFPEVRVSPIDFVTLDQQNPIDGYDGRPIWIWTVDDKRRIEQLLDDARVECIITNRPDLAVKLRKARA
jgi:glycerophosphoryl diester phosphodiesterase